MSDEMKLSLKKFAQAVARLEEVCGMDKKDNIIRDSVIKRFEFTYELCWKTWKLYYRFQGVDLRHPRDVFMQVFRDGHIEDEQCFVSMIEDRNQSVHVYDEQDVNTIYKHIVESYLNAFQSMLKVLQKFV